MRANSLKKLLIYLIKGYQYAFSACLGHCCRFEPTCSSYACQAISQFGCIKGLLLTIRRLLRCHPWCPGGFDPIN